MDEIFYKPYLNKNRPGTTGAERTMNNTIYCPASDYHRAVEASGNKTNLIGYFYLPGRDNSVSIWPYSSVPGLDGWHLRKKFGTKYRLAPTMSDQLQSQLPNWVSTAGVRWGSHRDKNNVPKGGNFLFEDGHVQWYRFDVKNTVGTIDVGSKSGPWVLFYKPYNVATNL